MNKFKGFERVSSSPYMAWRVLVYMVVVCSAVGGVYYLVPFEDPKSRNMATGGALFLMFILVMIFQHSIATFNCKRCKCRMIKDRDSEPTGITFYYSCDACRIYWKNRAVSFSSR